MPKLSVKYYWLTHTLKKDWLSQNYPNINEDDNNFKSEKEAIKWLLKQKELDIDFGDSEHFELQKIYIL